jgi:hypothetical protein
MIGPSALSLAVRALRDRVASALELAPAQVLIGTPAAAAKEAHRDPRTLVNLFLHRVEATAHGRDESASDPLLVGAHALITAFAEPETDASSQVTVSAGENDLRLIGGVLRVLHEQPLLRLRDADGAEVAQLQLLIAPLPSDELNHLWSTQGDTPYRLSVACELALMPLPLAPRIPRAPRVGAMRLAVDATGAPAVDAGPVLGFTSPPVQVDGTRSDWAPAIRFVDGGGRLQLALALPSAALPATLALAAAGAPGSEITLAWERWDRASGWHDVPDGGAPPLRIAQTTLEDGNPPALPVAVPLSAPGQAMVYAWRRWRGADGSQRSTRSNPLLVSVHDGSAT